MSNAAGLNLHDAEDFDLHSDDDLDPLPPEHTHHAAAWITTIALLAAAIGGGYYAYRQGVRWQDLRRFWRPATTISTTTAAPVATTAPPAALGGTADAVDVPPLDASDAVVRSLVGRLSANPDVAAWLATNDLIRNFTVVVTNIADGHGPAKQLRALKPQGLFKTTSRGGQIEVDPGSYQRYSSIAMAAASVDASGAARLYATLKPRIEEAHRELGNPDPSFDQTLQRAIVVLLQTPSPQAPILLQPATKGIGYEYHDGKLESLTSAQKQLLRMGPANTFIVQAKLRDVAAALGIPATALPSR